MVTRKLVISLVALPVLLNVACAKKKKSETATPTEAEPAVQSAGGGEVPATTTPTTTSDVSTDTETATVAATVVPVGAPSRVAPPIPGSLLVGGASLQEGEDASAQATTSQAEGYSRLTGKVTEMLPTIVDLTKNLYFYYANATELEAACLEAEGEDWTSCTQEDLEVTLTQEIADEIYASLGGKDALPANVVDQLDAEVGEAIPLPPLTITKLEDDPAGFKQCVMLAFDEQSSSTYCWALDDAETEENESKVSVTYAYSIESETPEAAFSGSYRLSYLSEQELLVLNNEGRIGNGASFRDAFTLQPNAASDGDNAIIFTLDITGTEPQYGDWGAKIVGVADDAGGYVETEYSWDETTITSLTLSGTATAGSFYVWSPDDATVPASGEDSLWTTSYGYLIGNGTDNSVTAVSYWGPLPSVPSNKLFLVTNDPETGAETFTDANLYVANVTLQMSTNFMYYQEEFDAEGNVLYFCGKLTEGGACDSEDGTAGAYATSYETASEGDLFDFAALPTVTLTGTNANANHLYGYSVYVVRSDIDLSTVSPYDDYSEGLLAVGHFFGDWSDMSTTDMTGYEFSVLATSVDAFDGARVFLLTYDADGNAVFDELTTSSDAISLSVE
jgi:hypothetical protein